MALLDKEISLKVVSSTQSPLSAQDYPESGEHPNTRTSLSESLQRGIVTTVEPTAPLSRIDHSLSQTSDGTTPTMNCTSLRHSMRPTSRTNTTIDAAIPGQVVDLLSNHSVSSSLSGHDIVNAEIMNSSIGSIESTEFNLLLNDNANVPVVSEILSTTGAGPRKSWTPNMSPSFSPKRTSGIRNFSKDFKPPLSNSSNHSTASTESNLIIESQRRQYSGYGRPDTFVTPTGAGQRKSWKPKVSPKISPKQNKDQRASCPQLTVRSDHNVQYQSKSPLLDARTPPKDHGNGRMVIGTTFLSSVAPPWQNDEPRSGTSDSKTDSSFSPKRSSAPILSHRNPRAATSLSPMPTHRASVSTLGKVTDPEALPPAFRAAFRSSCNTMGKIEPSSLSTQKKRSSYDPTMVERVNPAPKEKLHPSKLKYQWPPQKSITSKRLQTLSFLRVFDFKSDARTVKERRRAFEGEEMRLSTTFPIVVDIGLGHLSDKKAFEDEVDIRTPDNPSPLIMSLNRCDDTLDPDPLPKVSIHADQDAIPCVELLSALKIQTSLKVRWGGPTYRMIDGPPLHYNGTYTDESGNEVEFAPLLEDRFGDISRDKALVVPRRSRDSNDVAMASPRRSYDDWSDDDSAFSGDSQYDDEILSPDDQPMQVTMDILPTLWLAPVLPDVVVKADETINLWRMKRVWDDPVIDDKEPEHLVHAADVMLKVKELLGIPGENSNIADEYDPEASMWCIKKIYDIGGEIHEASQTVKVNEKRLSMSFREVATISSSINQLHVNGGLQSDKPDVTSHEGVEAPTSDSTRIKSTPEPTSSQSQLQDETKSAPNISKRKDGTFSPRPKSERNSKREQTIWDLLSPPPVSFVVNDGK